MLITGVHCALSLTVRLLMHGWKPKEGEGISGRGRGKREENGGRGEGEAGGRGQTGRREEVPECWRIFNTFYFVMTRKEEGVFRELVTGLESFQIWPIGCLY